MTIEMKNKILVSIRTLKREKQKAIVRGFGCLVENFDTIINDYVLELNDNGFDIEKPVSDPLFKNIQTFRAIHAYSGKKYVDDVYPFITRQDAKCYFIEEMHKTKEYAKSQLRIDSNRMIGRLLNLGFIKQYENGWIYIKEK